MDIDYKQHADINMLTKITINNKDRAVVIPIEYDPATDSISIQEIQIDPIPNKDENISKDIVLTITKLIMDMFNNIKG